MPTKAKLAEVEIAESPYAHIRELNAKDTQAVATMIAKVTGDPRLQNAVASGDQSLIMMAMVACIMDKAMHELALLVADLVGITENYDIKVYRRKERELAREEERLPDPENLVRAAMEDDILDELGTYPPTVHMDVVTELANRPTFDGFLASSRAFAAALQGAFSRFQTPSLNGTGSAKEK